MVFTKEILEQYNFDIIPNLPTTNEIDIRSITEGRVTKELYEVITSHFSRLNMEIYCIFIPASRFSDHSQWIPVDIEGYENCFEYSKYDMSIKLNTISVKDNIKLMVEKFNWCPPIIFVPELEGEICGAIWCHAIGFSSKNINYYKDKHIISSFDEAKILFEESPHWVHVKIG